MKHTEKDVVVVCECVCDLIPLAADRKPDFGLPFFFLSFF